MSKEMIYTTALDTIGEALEITPDADFKGYVAGVIDMADTLVERQEDIRIMKGTH